MARKKHCHTCGSRLIKKYIDAEAQNRLFCETCSKPIYENPIPATAAVVFNDAGQVLLVQRNVEPAIGFWCLPGGYLELNESPEKGCIRELKEETALKGEIDELLANIHSYNLFYRSLVVMGYSIKSLKGTLQAGDDCRDARFFELGDMPPIIFRSHRKIFKKALARRRGKKSMESSKKRPEYWGQWGAYVITSRDHVKLAEAACKGGAKILQYRDKDIDRKRMLEKANSIRSITREYGTIFIINDYIDVALLCGADGVHLGQDDIPITEARKLTPLGFIIGISTHSLEQAMKAEQVGADYIGCGPVFSTPTKEDYIPIGIETLEQVLQNVGIPVVAIGGLNPDNLPQIQEVGACNFAMVRAFQDNTERVVRFLNK